MGFMTLMAHRQRTSSKRLIIGGLAVVLCMPGPLMAIVAAKQSRMMVVHVDDSSHGVLETFESSAGEAGLLCQRSKTSSGNPSVYCNPAPIRRNQGGVMVIDRKEKKRIVISAFAPNVSTPQGELDPAVDATLRRFKAALAGNLHVLRIDYCWAPKLEGCGSSD